MTVPKVCLECADPVEYFDGSKNCPHCDGTLVDKPLEIKVFGLKAKRIEKGQQFIASIGSVEGHTVVTLYEMPPTKCANCGLEIEELTMTICGKCVNEPETVCTKHHTHSKRCMQ